MNKNIKKDYFSEFSRKTLSSNFKAKNLYHEKDCHSLNKVASAFM